MAPADELGILRGSPLFFSLRERALQQVIDRGERAGLAAGEALVEALVEAGPPAGAFYVLLAGGSRRWRC